MSFHVIRSDRPETQYRYVAERNVEMLLSRIGRTPSKEFSAETLFHDSMVVVTGVSNPLARRRKIQLAELADEPWIQQPPENYFGGLVVDAFQASGLPPPRLTVSSNSPLLRHELLATGRFLAIVPGFSLRLPRKHPTLRALRVELPNTRHPVAIVSSKNRDLSPLAKLFIERVRAFTKPLASVG